jgi:hypothetical protein
MPKDMFILRTPEIKQNCLSFIKDLNENKLYTVEIAEKKPQRSTQQNRLLWSWYKPISDYIGETSEETHERVKVKVLGVYEKEVAGVTLIKPNSTRNLSVKEMSNFLMAVEMLALKLNVKLPPSTYFGLER